MKKFIALTLIFVLTVTCFTGCGKTDATKNVIEMIKSIGDVTDESGDFLDDIKEAYDALTEREQKKVSNYSRYEKAVEEYNEIVNFNTLVVTCVDAAVTDFSSDSISFDEIISTAEDLLSQYDKMSKKRKALVTPEIDELESAIETIEGYRSNAIKCAAVYCKAFLEVYAENNYEITDIGCICQLRDDTQYMFFALTAKNDKKEVNYYAQARFAQPNIYNAIVKNPEYFFATEPVDESSDALASRNITLSLEDVINEINNPTEETTAAATTASSTTVPATTQEAK